MYTSQRPCVLLRQHVLSGADGGVYVCGAVRERERARSGSYLRHTRVGARTGCSRPFSLHLALGAEMCSLQPQSCAHDNGQPPRHVPRLQLGRLGQDAGTDKALSHKR